MTRPAGAYAWLNAEPGPKMLIEALKLYGTVEVPGAGNNAAILAWAKDLDLTAIYTADSVPWCGLFMAVVARRAGKVAPVAPLWAKSWADFGVPSPVPGLGDVLVFAREGGGHVALYVGEDDAAFHVLGGNQADAVTLTRIPKARLFAARRPLYQAQPANVRPIALGTIGGLSAGEA